MILRLVALDFPELQLVPGDDGIPAQPMCPTWQPPEEWQQLLGQTLCQVDYSASVGYGLFYPLAAYWRAVRRGVVGLP